MNLKTGISICFALVIMVTGAFLPPNTYAEGGRHGKGGHHGNWHGHLHGHGHNYGRHYGHNYGRYYDDSLLIGLGLGFVFSPLVYGYPYYAPAPIYSAPAQLPPQRSMPEQRSDTATREQSAYCREYTKEILVDGKEEKVYGTACQQGDGRWRIMN